MTQNQIEYWKLQELKRANLINEEQARAIAAETRRHNLATESNDYARIEVQRQGNYLTSLANAETARANRAKENLSITDQILRQYLAQLQADTSRYAADVNRQNALTSAQAQITSAGISAGATKYAADTNLRGTAFTANKNYEGTVYSANSRSQTANADRTAQTIRNAQESARAAAILQETIRHNKEMEKTERFKAETNFMGALLKGVQLSPNKGKAFITNIR